MATHRLDAHCTVHHRALLIERDTVSSRYDGASRGTDRAHPGEPMCPCTSCGKQSAENRLALPRGELGVMLEHRRTTKAMSPPCLENRYVGCFMAWDVTLDRPRCLPSLDLRHSAPVMHECEPPRHRPVGSGRLPCQIKSSTQIWKILCTLWRRASNGTLNTTPYE